MSERAPALSRTVEGIIIASAYLLPMAVLPGAIQDASGLPKSVALAFVTALLVGAGLARVFIYREALCPSLPVTAPLVALLAATALSAVNTSAPAATLNGLLYFGAMLTLALLASGLPARDRVMNAVMISAGVVSLYGIGQFMGFEPIEWSSHFKPRIFATLGNPVFLGGFLAAVFPLAFARWLHAEREETKDLLVLLLAVLAVGVYLTWTRSAWLALAASTSFQMAVLWSSPGGRRLLAANRSWLVSAALIALIAVALISSVRMFGKKPVPLGDRISDALDPSSYSVLFRRVTSEVAGLMAMEHPIVGAGAGSYRAHYPFLRLKTKAARGAPQHFLASQERYTHNDHLQILAERGVIGLGAWIWFLLVFFRWCMKRPWGDWFPLGAAGCVAAVCVDATLNFPLQIVPTAWVFFLAVGLLGAGTGRPSPAPPSGAGRLRRSIAAGVLIAACGAAVIRPGVRALEADRRIMEGDRQVSYNNYEMAAVYYGMGVECAPLNEFLRFRFSVATVRAGRFGWRGEALDRGLKHARAALRLGYHDENVYKHIGDIFEKKTDLPKAIRALRVSHELHPLREDVANNLAYYLTEAEGNLDEALRLARLAVSRAPEDPTYLDTLGWVLLKAGKRGEALAVLKKALRNMPKGSDDPRHAAAAEEIRRHLRMAGAARR